MSFNDALEEYEIKQQFSKSDMFVLWRKIALTSRGRIALQKAYKEQINGLLELNLKLIRGLKRHNKYEVEEILNGHFGLNSDNKEFELEISPLSSPSLSPSSSVLISKDFHDDYDDIFAMLH